LSNLVWPYIVGWKVMLKCNGIQMPPAILTKIQTEILYLDQAVLN